ncbi:MAG TPA: PIN domain-containing protein [Gemmataceae bacterium]|nr:PIN domain-containing protein [Gemmataceae bacterium]
MNVLLDTNILARLAEPGTVASQVAHDAVRALPLRGDVPCLVPQVLYELWVVATRPVAANGLGFTPAQADAELARVLTLFPLFFPDTAAIFPEWRRLVVAHQVSGRNAHDTRLVAAMAVHGLTHLLTFNTAHFARFPGITVLDPAVIAVAPPPP